MPDMVQELLNNAPDGVRVVDRGANDRGERVIQWWACSRFGLSVSTGTGFMWGEAVEIIRDSSRHGFALVGVPQYVEGRAQLLCVLRDVIADYRPTVQV